MPNRVIRDWTDSEKINTLSANAERFFIRLLMKVDDFGCYRADEVLLNSKLFPLKEDIRKTDISRWMDECQKSGLITLYEVENKRYLQVIDFKQRKRQMESKYPHPKNGSQMTVICQTDDGLNRIEEEKKENRIGTPQNTFWDKEEKLTRPIEECLEICLRTERWINDNKTNRDELLLFNNYLSKQGTYEISPIEYKKYFAKLKGKYPEMLKKESKNLTIEQWRELAKQQDLKESA